MNLYEPISREELLLLLITDTLGIRQLKLRNGSYSVRRQRGGKQQNVRGASYGTMASPRASEEHYFCLL